MNFNPRSHERSDQRAVDKMRVEKISIHAPTRGATALEAENIDIITFQSTLPREERHDATGSAEPARDFNPRSHERSDYLRSQNATPAGHFNPRSHERSDGRCRIRLHSDRNFNPRSHERSDGHTVQGGHGRGISIHAPTRGATYYTKRRPSQIRISIHAPTRGATRTDKEIELREQFQSTLPREERQLPELEAITDTVISIHAPTRGATLQQPWHLQQHRYFNPRSHERSDPDPWWEHSARLISIHAPTRGATPRG